MSFHNFRPNNSEIYWSHKLYTSGIKNNFLQQSFLFRRWADEGELPPFAEAYEILHKHSLTILILIERINFRLNISIEFIKSAANSGPQPRLWKIYYFKFCTQAAWNRTNFLMKIYNFSNDPKWIKYFNRRNSCIQFEGFSLSIFLAPWKTFGRTSFKHNSIISANWSCRGTVTIRDLHTIFD